MDEILYSIFFVLIFLWMISTIVLLILDVKLLIQSNKTNNATRKWHLFLSILAVIGVFGGVGMFIVSLMEENRTQEFTNKSVYLTIMFSLLTIIEGVFVILFKFYREYKVKTNNIILISHIATTLLFFGIGIDFFRKLFNNELLPKS